MESSVDFGKDAIFLAKFATSFTLHLISEHGALGGWVSSGPAFPPLAC